MKLVFALIVAVLAFAGMPANAPSTQFFSKVRDVSVERLDRQNYAVADGELWLNARSDLGDVRLYSDGKEVPYALTVERASCCTIETRAKILNLGTVRGAVEFIIETGVDEEYDRVALKLSDSARDFVTRAKVAGSNDLLHGPWIELGDFPLYDFSREKLGRNFALKLPSPSRFAFLRVAIPELRPDQIKDATIAMAAERKARWTYLEIADPVTTQEPGRTVITWSQQSKAPVERIRFVVDPAQTNFRRHVGIRGIPEERNSQEFTVGEGEISRIHYVRGTKVIDSEELDLDVSAPYKRFKAIIENGDDPPLRLQSTPQPLTHERRFYFDPQGKSSVQLYYGDEKLGAPRYEYATLFQRDPEAPEAKMGPGRANPAFTGRPDDRPWTERHGWVLWVALLLAVVGLGAVALRGLRTEAKRA